MASRHVLCCAGSAAGRATSGPRPAALGARAALCVGGQRPATAVVAAAAAGVSSCVVSSSPFSSSSALLRSASAAAAAAAPGETAASSPSPSPPSPTSASATPSAAVDAAAAAAAQAAAVRAAAVARFRERVASGPDLGAFVASGAGSEPAVAGDGAVSSPSSASPPATTEIPVPNLPHLAGRTFAVETYGCQMNTADSQLVVAVLEDAGCVLGQDVDAADIVLLNTCAIREKAEDKVRARLNYFRRRRVRDKQEQVVAVLGCMAERLKDQLIEEKLCDVVVGPDAYRELPRLLSRAVELDEPVMDVALSADETYADLLPAHGFRKDGGVSSFVSIMRGCNNMCSYCIVPFTRGRERSRAPASIVAEVQHLVEAGYREVVLLGQNVNSYNVLEGTRGGSTGTSPKAPAAEEIEMAEGFSTVYKRPQRGFVFADLLDELSARFPETWFRFTSPHPKDFPDRVLRLIASRPNLCNSIHMPAQSGSSAVLKSMRRGYTRESYDALVRRIDELIGRDRVSLSSDFISGFCGETEEDHQATLSLLEEVQFDQAFMFAYSLREKTHAHRRLEDDVPLDVKKRRLAEVIDTFNRHAEERGRREMGREHVVLIDGTSRRDDAYWSGRTDTNKRVFIAKAAEGAEDPARPGTFVKVKVTRAGKHSMSADVLYPCNVRGEQV